MAWELAVVGALVGQAAFWAGVYCERVRCLRAVTRHRTNGMASWEITKKITNDIHAGFFGN